MGYDGYKIRARRRMGEKFFAHTRFQTYGTAVMDLGIVIHK
jgi:hypothetical protein